jgi:TPR repeat protein
MGDPQGCSKMGFLYEKGDQGVARDLRKARELYTKSCDGSVFGDCYALGKLLERGDSAIVPRDDPAAVTLFKRSCEGGVASGCYDLALRTQIGNGVPKDLNQAAALFRRACDGGETRACARVKRR